MTEIADPNRVLDELAGFSPLRRILLATTGTLQSTLTAFFAEPVDVRVVDQRLTGASIERGVELYCRHSGTIACRARTEIDVDDPGIRELIEQRELGLGQITATLGREARFEFVSAGTGEDHFWRVYDLAGDGFRFHIREEFPADLYLDGS